MFFYSKKNKKKFFFFTQISNKFLFSKKNIHILFKLFSKKFLFFKTKFFISKTNVNLDIYQVLRYQHEETTPKDPPRL